MDKSNIIEVSQRELLDVGFWPPNNNGIFWRWDGSCGVHLSNGKFTPCDMFDNGKMQYSDESFENFIDAAKHSINYFT